MVDDDDDDDLEENQDDELLADSGSQGDSLDQMSCNQTTPELPSSPSSSDLSSSALFSDVIEKTKSIALHKLTNIEFWIHHLDSIFTNHCQIRSQDLLHVAEDPIDCACCDNCKRSCLVPDDNCKR